MTQELKTVSVEVEIPESLYEAMQQYLEGHEQWSHERIWQAAGSLFLMQNGINHADVNSLYLDSLFGSRKER